MSDSGLDLDQQQLLRALQVRFATGSVAITKLGAGLNLVAPIDQVIDALVARGLVQRLQFSPTSPPEVWTTSAGRSFRT